MAPFCKSDSIHISSVNIRTWTGLCWGRLCNFAVPGGFSHSGHALPLGETQFHLSAPNHVTSNPFSFPQGSGQCLRRLDGSAVPSGQAGHPNPTGPKFRWLLQPCLPGSQEEWNLEINHRPVPSEQIPKGTSLQDGNYKIAMVQLALSGLGLNGLGTSTNQLVCLLVDCIEH
jgi:hypothetical protein